MTPFLSEVFQSNQFWNLFDFCLFFCVVSGPISLRQRFQQCYANKFLQIKFVFHIHCKFLFPFTLCMCSIFFLSPFSLTKTSPGVQLVSFSPNFICNIYTSLLISVDTVFFYITVIEFLPFYGYSFIFNLLFLVYL